MSTRHPQKRRLSLDRLRTLTFRPFLRSKRRQPKPASRQHQSCRLTPQILMRLLRRHRLALVETILSRQLRRCPGLLVQVTTRSCLPAPSAQPLTVRVALARVQVAQAAPMLLSSRAQALPDLVRVVSSVQAALQEPAAQAAALVLVAQVVQAAVLPVVAVAVATPLARSVRVAASPRLASRSGRSAKSLKCARPRRWVASRFHAVTARR